MNGQTYIEEIVFTALTSLFNGRVFPGVAADGSALPYAVQSIPSIAAGNTLSDGPASRTVTLQLDVYAMTRAESRSLAASVEAALLGLTDETMGVTQQLMQTAYDSDVRLHRVMQQFNFLLPRSGGVL